MLRAPDGAVVERVERRIGFRRVEVRGVELLVNGRAVLIRGVNRHDFDRRTGRVISAEDMLADVVAMKRWGFNALRTSHYPNDPYLLDVCDELGLYVIDEADIESHGWYDDVCHDPRYRSAFVDRVARMIERDRHHPSIIAWSLGNESGYGVNHDAAAGWARRADPSRPLHYEGAIRFDWTSPQTASDLTCPMYPPISAIVAHARSGLQRHPLIMCEFSHAMGNSNGTLAEHWDAIEATPGLQGGFIWEWRDHGLDQRLPDGTVRAAYGGDFGDVPNDGTFVLDGMVFPDRRPKPAMFEHMHLASPMRAATDDAAIAAARDGRVTLENRGEFRGTGWLRATWEATVDGEPVAGGDLPLPSIAPGDRAEVSIPGWRLPPEGAGERWLTLRFLTADATGWAPADHEMGWAQVPLDAATGPGAAASTAAGWTGGVVLNEAGQLLLPAFAAPPALSLWRAPTDNDRIGGMAKRWTGWGLATLTRRLDGIERAADAVTDPRDVDHRDRDRGAAHPADVGRTRRPDPRRGDGRDPGHPRRPAAGRDRARAGRRPRGPRMVRARAARDVSRPPAWRAGRPVAVDGDRRGHALSAAAGERRARRHALASDRRTGRRDPAGPRPTAPGLGHAPAGGRPRRGGP